MPWAAKAKRRQGGRCLNQFASSFAPHDITAARTSMASAPAYHFSSVHCGRTDSLVAAFPQPAGQLQVALGEMCQTKPFSLVPPATENAQNRVRPGRAMLDGHGGLV